eukprot:8573768-Alexandrium_andersonii.AAC.1
MSASLVGSEMCIRDRLKTAEDCFKQFSAVLSSITRPEGFWPLSFVPVGPVSYTHLDAADDM